MQPYPRERRVAWGSETREKIHVRNSVRLSTLDLSSFSSAVEMVEKSVSEKWKNAKKKVNNYNNNNDRFVVLGASN